MKRMQNMNERKKERMWKRIEMKKNGEESGVNESEKRVKLITE